MTAHIVNGQFQSDKYPTCPPGKVPLSVRDKTAQDLLWTYAQRRRHVDAEFSEDLEMCLRAEGYAPMAERAATPRPISHLCDVLKHAYGDVKRATYVLQRAGVDVAQICTDQPVAKLWRDALVYARDHEQIDQIVKVVLGDPSVRAYHDKIRSASDDPPQGSP